MLMYDLFCGYGGAAQPFVDNGWEVIGFDNHPSTRTRYPGQLVLQDITTLRGDLLAGADLIWASPPCTQFSTMRARWGRSPELGIPLVAKAKEIIEQARPRHWVVENVRGSVKYITPLLGEPLNRGAQHNNGVWLWSDLHPIIPLMRKDTWQNRSKGSRELSKVPYPIADAVRRAAEA